MSRGPDLVHQLQRRNHPASRHVVCVIGVKRGEKDHVRHVDGYLLAELHPDLAGAACVSIVRSGRRIHDQIETQKSCDQQSDNIRGDSGHRRRERSVFDFDGPVQHR